MEVCDAIEKGIKEFDPTIETIKHPLADGGEGTLAILENYFDLNTITVLVKNPVFNDIEATYKVSKEIAFIEMANASGLQLLKKEERNCYHTSTFGTGQLVLDAIQKGYKKIVLFIGGSATNDAGIGMATALGYRFYNSQNELINPIGKELINISKIDLENVNSNINNIDFTVVCDVKNPLFGINGAAFVYGSQKGASSLEIELLDQGLINFSQKVKEFLNKKVGDIPGAGAAGGLGAGAVAFLDAYIKSGIDFVLEQTNFSDLFKEKVDLIITGEGSVDKQTIEGKVIKGISEVAKKQDVPFAIISGIVKDEELIKKNMQPFVIQSIIGSGIVFEEAINNASKYVTNLAFETMKLFQNNFNRNC